MKKVIAVFVSVFLLVGMVLPNVVCAQATEALTEIDWDASKITIYSDGGNPFFTEPPVGTTDGSYELACLTDGIYELPSVTQIQMPGVPYDEDGVLFASCVIEIDLEKVYELDRIAITWYSARGARYYIHSGDGTDWDTIADETGTASGTTLIESDFAEKKRVQYLEIEIVGYARYEDIVDGSNWFPINEIDIFGTEATDVGTPTSTPSSTPTEVPTTTPTKTPSEVPSAEPSINAEDGADTNEDNGSVGLIIGIIAGTVVLVGLGVFFIIKKGKKS